MTATDTVTTVVVPGTHLMAALVGPRDQHLRQIEGAFPATEIRVRGNEITAQGEECGPGRRGCSRSSSTCSSRATTSTPPASTASCRWSATTSARARCSPTTSCAAPRAARSAPSRPVRSATSTPSSSNVITFGIGPAGTGKSWLAVAMAVKALQAKQVQRIILTRPAVEAGERLGFLPGDLMAKIDPYLRPLYDALYDMVEPEGAQRLLERQTVEVAPLAFMRGRTLNNSFIILDEAQNTTPEQMKMFLTRIGFGSRVVVTGDVTQVDVPNGKSGLVGLERMLQGIDGLTFVHLGASDVVRHRIVADIVAAYERTGPAAPDQRGGRRCLNLRVPPSAPTRPSMVGGADEHVATVVATNAQTEVDVDVDRWCRLALGVLRAQPRGGELTLTFVDRDEIAELNAEHLGQTGPTDVLSFPHRRRPDRPARPACPCCSATSWSAPASPPSRRRRTPGRSTTSSPCSWCTACCTCSATTTPSPTRPRRCAPRERDLLEVHHWHGPAPDAFRQEHGS